MTSSIQTVEPSTTGRPVVALHVCASATCVHDYMASPGTDQQQTSTVMPLWEAPLDRTA